MHLRLPFSFFLLPVFCFAVSQSAVPDPFNTLIIFTALHLFIYPASNSYNSYMDRDKGSIGALKNPPPVTRKVYYASNLLDVTGLLLGALIDWKLVLLLSAYIGISKAYSWKKIRLKKYPYAGWLVVMLFQGAYTYMLVHMSITGNFSSGWFDVTNIKAMLLASLLIGGFYPLTQIYQHDEDSLRGDITISYKLGIKGTFIFCAALFAIAFAFSVSLFSNRHLIIFTCSLAPVGAYFLQWAARSFRNPQEASYTHAMRVAFISSLCMTLCFILHYFVR